MRRFLTPLAIAAALWAAPATAQIQPDVTVNPNASGTKVLLYPGGKYGRVERPLLQPGEADPNAPVYLHMPRKHAAPRVAAKPKPKPAAIAAAPQPQATASLSDLPKESAASLVMQDAARPAPAKPAPAKPKPVAVARQTPKKAPPPSDDSATSFLSGGQPAAQTPAPPKRVAVAKQAPAPSKQPPPSDTAATSFLSGNQTDNFPTIPSPPPPRVASTAPNEISSPVAGTQRSSIQFSPGAEEPSQSATETVRTLAPSLSTALWSGTAHVQLEAYGGAHGDKGSDARRLSLKRALIIRQMLIDDGIPSERIVVRAMGGASSGALDRVDISVAS